VGIISTVQPFFTNPITSIFNMKIPNVSSCAGVSKKDARSQSYDRELQRQRHQNLQRHKQPGAF
jgi:hypothetical protein